MFNIKTSLIFARANNGVIGLDNKLPWQLRRDMKFFKETTHNKIVIMGRNTWESMNSHPLKDRLNYIVSSTIDQSYQQGTRKFTDLEQALQSAKRQSILFGNNEFFVIGGAKIYEQTFDIADKLYVTTVDCNPVGDAVFNREIDPKIWEVIDEQYFKKDGYNSENFSIKIYQRRLTPQLNGV